MTKRIGKIIKVSGPVVDVAFEGESAVVNEALHVKIGKETLTLEVAFETGDNQVKALALGSTDGLIRGMEVEATGSPIKVPVGNQTLGKIFNVLGEPIDKSRIDQKDKTLSYKPIHKSAPPLTSQQTKAEMLETGKPMPSVIESRELFKVTYRAKF